MRQSLFPRASFAFRATGWIVSWATAGGAGAYLLGRILEEQGLDSFDLERLVVYLAVWGGVCGLIEAMHRS